MVNLSLMIGDRYFGMSGALAAGLIAGTGLKLSGALKSNVMGAQVCIALVAITFVAIAWLRVPLVWVLLILGGAAWAWAYKKLEPT